MPVSSYPRVTVQGTGTKQNTQNGSALMVVNPITGKYEAATAATFGGGGGGDATASNQTTQITEAQASNSILSTIQNDQTIIINQLTNLTNYFINGTNTYILNDTLYVQVANSISTQLLPPISFCKYITLYTLSTATNVTISVGGTDIILEGGKSIRINTQFTNSISISSIIPETVYCIITGN